MSPCALKIVHIGLQTPFLYFSVNYHIVLIEFIAIRIIIIN